MYRFRRMYVWIDSSIDRPIDASMDPGIDGSMDPWMDGCMDGWMDGCVKFHCFNRLSISSIVTAQLCDHSRCIVFSLWAQLCKGSRPWSRHCTWWAVHCPECAKIIHCAAHWSGSNCLQRRHLPSHHRRSRRPCFQCSVDCWRWPIEHGQGDHDCVHPPRCSLLQWNCAFPCRFTAALPLHALPHGSGLVERPCGLGYCPPQEDRIAHTNAARKPTQIPLAMSILWTRQACHSHWCALWPNCHAHAMTLCMCPGSVRMQGYTRK